MAKTRSLATMADIPIQSEPEPGIPVKDAIQAGIDLINKKKSKCDRKKKTVKPVYQEEVPKCPRCYVKKIVYPEPNVFKGCQHGKTKFQLRLGINRQHHLKVLAAPNPVSRRFVAVAVNIIIWDLVSPSET